MITKASNDSSARSPFAGCAILIAALLVMVFLVVFSTVTLFRQFNEIAKFTGEKPVLIEVSSLDDQEPALNRLAERLEAFRQQLDREKETTLALTADDLNLAIAAYQPLADLRGTFRVMAIEGETLRIAISFPLNGKPRFTKKGESGWIASDSRFLNGTLIARPALLKHEVILLFDQIEVPGASVAREFIEQMSPYRITERYLADELLGPAMGKLTRVGISDGTLVLTRIPGESAADEISNEQVDHASNRFFVILGVAACVFLLFAGLIVFLGLRGKRNRY
jgi:hypothetical protein